MWRPSSDQPAELADLVLRDGVIAEIGPAGASPGKRQSLDALDPTGGVIDAGGRLVTPGWWNCHVHLTEPAWSGASKRDAKALQAELEDMFSSRGFTTVVDVGSNSRDTLPLIGRIDGGELRGPRLLTAAEPLHPPFGWPFYTRRDVPWFLWPSIPGPLTARGAARVVRAHHRRGAALTKLFAGSYVTPSRVSVMPLRTARAAAAQSRALGMPVFAHPSNAAGVRRALDAPVDVLAHLPDETAGTEELMIEAARRGVYVVPTLHMFATTVTSDPEYLDPIDGALRTFLAAGGRVLFGTDVGYMGDRSIGGETRAMARCGMSPADILRSLTSTPSALLDTRPGAGTLDPGAPADVTILESTSLTPTAEDFAHVHTVIRNGVTQYP